MPHVIVEYSENLKQTLDIPGLLDALHAKAVSLESLPTGGIRSRAIGYRDYRVADSHPDNGFIYITLRIGQGRSDETQKVVGQALFDALNHFVREACKHRPLSLGLEIQEIDPQTRWKQSNIREHMNRRQSPGED
ncbi:MAG: hypothetical protein AB8B96_13570 [Lysobacterales bacterium]